jgi:hypothetical protein
MRRRYWLAAFAIAAVLVVMVAILAASSIPFSSDAARRRVVATLAAELDGEVELRELQFRLLPRVRAEGAGLVVRHKGRRDVPPLISIDRFVVEGSVFNLLRRHISDVTVEGLTVAIPPDRDDHDPEAGDQTPVAAPAAKSEPEPARSDAQSGDLSRTLVIDRLVSTNGQLVILPKRAGKEPRTWGLHEVRMEGVGVGRTMPFDVTLTNAVPPGQIVTKGAFGPWQREHPGRTPLMGAFTFENADLGVFKGIAGTLAARGTFGGVLERIETQGVTDTPDFRLTKGGRAVPLHATYSAVVDGTNGDTYLNQVDGSFLETSLTATGKVVDVPNVKGRIVELAVTMDKARLEDVLALAVKGDKPPMTGALQLQTTLVIPPGEADVVDKIRLEGDFEISETRFSDPDVQRKINELSQRGQGRMKEPPPQKVASHFEGKFKTDKGVLAIPVVAFDIPGALVRLSGTYGLEREVLDFSGTLFLDAKLSETVTGWKSLLLKMADPLFRGEGGGSAIPIKISGPRSNPSFGLDRGRIFKR